MCGLCGVIGPERAAAVEDLEGMARSLAHRGPDDFGVWTDRFEAEGVPYAVGLGHTRLAILDVSPLGHQPMLSGDGSCVVAYNGEIYNFRELREELARLGHPFRSDCDTEVLLQAFRAWEHRALGGLIGMFAFALWDAARSRLVLVRDRLGIKPLYYAYGDGLLTFGSELRALRRHRSFRGEIDRPALGRYLRYGYVAGPESIYRGVRRLAPGEMLVWERGRIRVEPYWSLLDPPHEPAPQRFEAAVDGLEALLGDAVEQRLVSDVPLGAFLSGGVDSSAVVALMQERARAPVRTFSIGFRDAGFDEAPFARAVAKHLGTEHTEWYLERGDVIGVAHDLPELYDEPFADPSAIPTVLLSRLTREHVTVALSGDGGDELFAGYDQHRKLAMLMPWLRLPQAARTLVAQAARLLPDGRARNALRHLRAPDALGVATRLETYFDEAVLEAACGAEGARPAALFERAFGSAPSADAVRRQTFADASVYLPDDILTKVDRASMSVGLEARVPLLDHRVVQFALGLPREVLWRNGATKAPLREVLYRRVPRQLIERPKHGFGMPIHTLLAHEIRAWTDRYLDPARLREEGNFDPQGVERLVAAARRERRGVPYPLWVLLCFQRWFARVHGGEGAGAT
jgi:asparagine synthase (glutamine-hydrolysing)